MNITPELDWLQLSMASFNGSGYADKYDANSYAGSYVAYKNWKKDAKALSVIAKYPTAPLGFAEELVHAAEPKHVPNPKRFAEFSSLHYDYDKHSARVQETLL